MKARILNHPPPQNSCPDERIHPPPLLALEGIFPHTIRALHTGLEKQNVNIIHKHDLRCSQLPCLRLPLSRIEDKLLQNPSKKICYS